MAGANHYNKIQVARGNKNNKTPLYGELFYDVASKSVFIGAKEGNTVVWKRFGGFDSIVIKGTTSGNSTDSDYFGDLGTPLPGDAYIVRSPISVSQPEIIYKADGSATRGKNFRRYDDFFKNGQVIVYVEEDVSNLPNAAVRDAQSGYGWIVLSGGQNASDIENDTIYQPVAAAADDPNDATTDNGKGLNDVQSALDYLFNNKMEYVGETENIDFTGNAFVDSLNEVLAQQSGISEEDAVIQAIAGMRQLKAGQWIIYNGPSKKITVGNSEYVLKKNTAIVVTGKVVSASSNGTDSASLSTTADCFPLGAADANDIEFQFTGDRVSDEAVANVSTLTIAGEATTLDNTNNTTVDEKVQSVTQALDVLHQTKADLNAYGKIPLSQIPSTFVGALQFIGTLNFGGSSADSIAIPANGKLTAKQLAAYMSALDDPDSMEQAQEGDFADKMHGELDAGDYVIINFATPTDANTNVDDNSSATNTKEITIVDDDDNVLFKVSSGDHVICNSINITTDDTANPPTSTITSVKLDHLNTSASVDNINGLKAAVQIDGTRRNEQTSKVQTNTTSVRELKETEVSVDAEHNIIDVGAPDTVLTPETTLGKNTIPVGNGGKALLNSEVSINGQDNASKWHDTTGLTGDNLTAAQAHNTELTGLLKDGQTEVTVEFPDKSGKLSVTVGDGTEDRLPKYDAHGNLIDSSLENKIDQNLGGQFNVFDQNGNKVLTLNYEELAKLIQYTLGTGANAKDITRRFDDTDGVTTVDEETGTSTTTQVKRSSHEGRTNVDEDTHTMLDDCSTIDGGEWE